MSQNLLIEIPRDQTSNVLPCRKGHGGHLPPKLPSCPQTNSFDNFLTSFATNVPQNVTIGGTTQNFLLAALFCTPNFHSSGDGLSSTVTSRPNLPLKFLVAPNRRSLAKCLDQTNTTDAVEATLIVVVFRTYNTYYTFGEKLNMNVHKYNSEMNVKIRNVS